jgi:hypothetical protein
MFDISVSIDTFHEAGATLADRVRAAADAGFRVEMFMTAGRPAA